MHQPATRHIVSVDDYLSGEQRSDVRHEFVNGEVLAMVGASRVHNSIAGNLFAALHSALRGGPCRVYMSDVKVRIEQTRDDRFYYPDLVVSCSREEPSPYYTTHPLLVVEVLSESTERHDRAEKFYHYRKLASLQEYVLVAQDLMRIEIYRRSTSWELELYGADDEISLDSVDLVMKAADAYEGTELAEDQAKEHITTHHPLAE